MPTMPGLDEIRGPKSKVQGRRPRKTVARRGKPGLAPAHAAGAEPAAATLGERLGAGDADAVAEVWAEFGARLARQLRQKYHSSLARDRAEEIALVAVERAWEHHADFDAAKGTLDAWLWCIADHCAADTLASPWFRQQRREVPLAGDDEPADTECGSNGSNHGLDDEDFELSPRVRAALAALAALPPREQYIVRADIRSPDAVASTGDLARELGVSESTVRRCRRHAHARLRVELTALGFGPDATASSRPFPGGGCARGGQRRRRRRPARVAGASGGAAWDFSIT